MGTLTVEVSTDNANYDTVAIHVGQQQAAQADAYTINAVSLANYISDSTYVRFGGFRVLHIPVIWLLMIFE